MRPTDVGQQATDAPYDQLQRSTDENSLITTVEKSPREHIHFTHANQGRMTRIKVANGCTKTSKWRTNKLHRFRNKNARFASKGSQSSRKIRHQDHSKSRLSRVVKKMDNSKNVVHRRSRDEESYESGDDDENIQSKDEDEDEDVQLIIIPRKPRKNLRPKVQEKDENDKDPTDDSENNERVSESSVDDSENDDRNSDDFINFNAKRKKLNTDKNDDATLTLDKVASEEDDDDVSENSHQSGSNSGGYDLHLKVKGKSGTHVKLSGDLPGNIGSLMAVGEDGGTVQIKNTNTREEDSKAKGSESLKTVDLQGADFDASTEEMAQNLISMRSGKIKQSPYPSTVLLKPGGVANEENRVEVNEDKPNQDLMPVKIQESNENVPQTFTSLTRDAANAKAEALTNQQPSNNIFAPMEFENGDDELMATSRLLDIAQKADDVSSLKEIKDPTDTVKSETFKSLKDSTNGKFLTFSKVLRVLL